MNHDSGFLAAVDKTMRLFVIFCITAIVIVLMHTIDHVNVATFKPNAEKPRASLMQRRKQFGLGANVSTAISVERKLVTTTNQFIGKLQCSRLAHDERVVFQHHRLDRSEEH